jgi:hypothetical protein
MLGSNLFCNSSFSFLSSHITAPLCLDVIEHALLFQAQPGARFEL